MCLYGKRRRNTSKISWRESWVCLYACACANVFICSSVTLRTLINFSRCILASQHAMAALQGTYYEVTCILGKLSIEEMMFNPSPSQSNINFLYRLIICVLFNWSFSRVKIILSGDKFNKNDLGKICLLFSIKSFSSKFTEFRKNDKRHLIFSSIIILFTKKVKRQETKKVLQRSAVRHCLSLS